MKKVETALISVFHKDGIVEFAQGLVKHGVKIYASGGTAKTLMDAGVPVTDVADLVGGGPILGHRVVTLSREVHAGLLARDVPEDIKELADLSIPYIDLVCADLYPLTDEIKKAGSTRESVVEKTDMGGPAMIRSAAKGDRVVICDPKDREKVLAWLDAGGTDEQFVRDLGAKGEYTVAGYVLASATYKGEGRYAVNASLNASMERTQHRHPLPCTPLLLKILSLFRSSPFLKERHLPTTTGQILIAFSRP